MKVVFLDRDGVINKYPGDKEYVKSWREFKFLPKVKSSLKKLNSRGYRIFVISNQAGISKRIYSQKSLDLVTKNMLKSLSAKGVVIDGVYYCTHRKEDNCSCRKPRTGLIDKAVNKLKKEGLAIERKKSFFIGDTIIDMQAGRLARLNTILIFSGKEKPQNKDNWETLPDYTAADLSKAVELILKQ
ncbi:MAG: HAD family hydrolase [Candidatus Omnitrophota bacterium]